MADTPVISGASNRAGFLPPGPGLYKFTFDDSNDGFDKGYWSQSLTFEDDALDNFLQQLVAGITQLPPDLVFPRWQPEPPNLPDFGTNWAAVGAVDFEPDPGWAYIQHDPANDGRDYLSNQETFTLFCSFYGPNAGYYARLLTNGIYISQNREVLQRNSMGLVDISNGFVVPELIKGKWTRRLDRRIRIHRTVRDVYPVLSLLSVAFTSTVQTPGNDLLVRSRTVTP